MVDLNLTKRQQEIFDFIKRYSSRHGYPPTVRDIGKAVGLASSSTVHAHLANLEKVGLLRRDPSKPRAIELLDRAATATAGAGEAVVRASRLPMVGHVAAGAPVLAGGDVEGYVQVPQIAGGGEAFLPSRSRPVPSTGGREWRREDSEASSVEAAPKTNDEPSGTVAPWAPPDEGAPWAPAGEVAPWAPPEEVAPWAPDDLDAG